MFSEQSVYSRLLTAKTSCTDQIKQKRKRKEERGKERGREMRRKKSGDAIEDHPVLSEQSVNSRLLTAKTSCTDQIKQKRKKKEERRKRKRKRKEKKEIWRCYRRSPRVLGAIRLLEAPDCKDKLYRSDKAKTEEKEERGR